MLRGVGVFDSGWTASIDTTDFPLTITHNLGVHPTKVEVFFRVSATAPVYSAIVQRQIASEVVTASFPNPVAGDVNVATLLFPSIHWSTTTIDVTFRVLNALPNNLTPVAAALFTDSAGSDTTNPGPIGRNRATRLEARRHQQATCKSPG